MIENMHALHYKDVVLVPNFSTLLSRSQADVTVEMGNFLFKVPVVPANMRCTIDETTACILDKNQCFYIMHRFDNDQFEFVKKANEEEWYCVSISIGVNQADYELLQKLYEAKLRVNFITVDIAHGHCEKMKDMLDFLKKWKERGTSIIAGNIVTEDAALDLVDWGADIVKVGIGQGYVCTTKDKTGFTMPMFTCVASMPSHIPVIADGGIRCNGDIAKAIKAGATMVMCGSLFARLSDSPSPTYKDHHTGALLKEYYGSASFYNKGHQKNIEGRRELIDTENMTYEEKLQEITEDLQSAISYAGGKNLLDLRKVGYMCQVS
jgi:GMP reductase